ncbi:MAG: LacI family DNA-binding transcriptional regulator [Thermomicrobiales bacterium]
MNNETIDLNSNGDLSGKPTMRDIADSAGVSVATVSMVLNGKPEISGSTRQRVIEVASGMDYQAIAQRISGVLETVSILIEHLPTSPFIDPFNRHILTSIEAEARKAGYRIVVEFASGDDEPLVGHWTGGWSSGILVLGGGDLRPDWVATAIELKLPVVIVDHFIPGFQVPTVVPDNFVGARAITRYLIEAGHTRIGFLRRPFKYWTLEECKAGYLLAMQQTGLGPQVDLIPLRISHGHEKSFGETLALLDLGRVAFERLLGMMRDGTSESDAPIKWTVPTRIIERASVRRIS